MEGLEQLNTLFITKIDYSDYLDNKLDQDIFCPKVKEVERIASQEHVDEKGDVRVIFNGHFESCTILGVNEMLSNSYLVQKEKRIKENRNSVRKVIEGASDVCYKSRCSL